MSKDNKTVLLQEFLNHWIAGDRKLQYLKDKAPEDFSELISLARVLEIYNINITSDTDVTTKYGQSPDFIVHVTNPKLYIEVTRAGTGYTTKERFCRFIKDAADKQQFNLDTLTIKKFLERIPYRLDNTEVEQKHGSQCTPIFCSHLLRELLTDRTIKNLNPVDRYSFIQTLLLFCQETLSNKQKSLKAFSEYTML